MLYRLRDHIHGRVYWDDSALYRGFNIHDTTTVPLAYRYDSQRIVVNATWQTSHIEIMQ